MGILQGFPMLMFLISRSDDKERLRASHVIVSPLSPDNAAGSVLPPGPPGPGLHHLRPAGRLRVPGRWDGGDGGLAPPQ